MCGRIFVKPSATLSELLESFGISSADIPTLNNIAPTDQVPVIYYDGAQYSLRDMRWWLHASWHRDPPNQTHPSFNARIETVLTLSSFRVPVRKHRGIVAADGFIEWKKHASGNAKQPYFVQGKSEPLLLAAIWDLWNDEVYSCAIITQEANEDFAELHNRMPLSLTKEQAMRWIDPKENAEELIQEFHGKSVTLIQQPVDTEINNARNKFEVKFLQNQH